ncbi:MAG: hypothetical protein HY720_24945 [Planctomycetes bacterium]|nr:hypothetical protein [Planctomycetota bacterium]
MGKDLLNVVVALANLAGVGIQIASMIEEERNRGRAKRLAELSRREDRERLVEFLRQHGDRLSPAVAANIENLLRD